MKTKLGINCGFAINRYIEPEVWGRIVGEELGLHSVQIVADLINPFWPEEYIDQLIGRIRETAKRYDFTVDSIFTSAFTRVNHLMNPDAEARKFWTDWFRKLLLIGSRLGAVTGGSHFGIMTFDTIEHEDKKKRVVEAGVKAWQELSFYAEEIGYEALIFEPMSVPREFANTVADTRKCMEAVNANCGVPMKVCLDVGHAPHPRERDPYPWLRELGKEAPIIHLQQTLLGKSMHWPFTEEHNKNGIIRAEKVLQCLEESGCEETILMFELSHREHWDTDNQVIPDHKASVDYWRKYVKD